MNTSPLISVLIPAYNREKYIGEALESVFAQSIDDVEIIVIDDGSTDKTIEVVQSYQDSRIVLLRNEVNKGISATRNHGLAHVRGKYIAMLDSDDVFLPNRFALQIPFLEAQPEIGVLGGWAKHIGSSNRTFTPEAPDHQLRARALYRCPMVHSSTMVRTEVVQTNHIRYNENYPASNDYDFWVKLLPHTQFHNLQEYVVLYRKHDQNISVTRRQAQKQFRVASSYLAFQLLLQLDLPKPEHEALFNIIALTQTNTAQTPLAEKALAAALPSIDAHPALDHTYLKRAIFKKFIDAYQNAGVADKVKMRFIKKYKVWNYLPMNKYYGVLAKTAVGSLVGR